MDVAVGSRETSEEARTESVAEVIIRATQQRGDAPAPLPAGLPSREALLALYL